MLDTSKLSVSRSTTLVTHSSSDSPSSGTTKSSFHGCPSSLPQCRSTNNGSTWTESLVWCSAMSSAVCDLSINTGRESTSWDTWTYLSGTRQFRTDDPVESSRPRPCGESPGLRDSFPIQRYVELSLDNPMLIANRSALVLVVTSKSGKAH